jgi:hypothetical protein
MSDPSRTEFAPVRVRAAASRWAVAQFTTYSASFARSEFWTLHRLAPDCFAYCDIAATMPSLTLTIEDDFFSHLFLPIASQ